MYNTNIRLDDDTTMPSVSIYERICHGSQYVEKLVGAFPSFVCTDPIDFRMSTTGRDDFRS